MFRVIVLCVAAVFMEASGTAFAQMMQRDENDHCPMCLRNWDGTYHKNVKPDTMVKPKSEQWLKGLREVLALEELSKKQYETDSKKFDVQMPYMTVIPQENEHIRFITELFIAYGAPADEK